MMKIFQLVGKKFFLRIFLRPDIYQALKICQVIFKYFFIGLSFLKYLHIIYTDDNIQYQIV
jgi:hypothetical protein